MSKPIGDMLWAGTESAYHEYLETIASGAELVSAGRVLYSSDGGDKPDVEDDDEEDDVPYLLSIQNGVGIVNISGSLTNRDSIWNQFLGVASYGAIRDAVIYAAESPKVSQILLAINSGGGQVSGLGDTANLIRMVNDKVKPVTAYTDGNMMSAAYWLGASAGEVYSSNVAGVGSIGVLSVHSEYSKQLEAEGVTTTVVRAGKYKALANAYEPLSAEARKGVQSNLDTVYKVFVQHVAETRNQPYDFVDQQMAQGREFIGEQALAAGLIDGITSYDELMSKLQSKALDNGSHLRQTTSQPQYGVDNMTKKALTEQDIAALAAGAMSAEAVASVAHAETAQVDAASEVTEINEKTEEAQASAEVTQKPQGTGADVVSFLQAQIREKDAALLAANVEVANLKAKAADVATHFDALVAIAAKSANNMRIALGGTAMEATALNAATVLAEHDALAKQFNEKFHVGGVSAASPADEVVDAALDPLFSARVHSFRQ